MKIKPSLPPSIMTPGKRQLVQHSVSPVPHKRHPEKWGRFSLFFSLSLSQTDNVIRISSRAVFMTAKCLDLPFSPPVLHHDPINYNAWPRLKFSPTLTIPPIKIEELKLPPPKPPANGRLMLHSALQNGKRQLPSPRLRRPAIEVPVHHLLDFCVPTACDDVSCFLDNGRRLILIPPPRHVIDIASAITNSIPVLPKTTPTSISINFLAKLTTLGIGRNPIDRFSLSTKRPTSFRRLEHHCVLDRPAFKTQDSDPPFVDPQRHQITPGRQETLNDTSVSRDECFLKLAVALQIRLENVFDKMFKHLRHRALGIRFYFDTTAHARQDSTQSLDILVRRNEKFWELIVGLQRRAREAFFSIFKNTRHRTLGIWLYLDVGTHALLDTQHFINVAIMIINALRPLSQHDEGIMRSPAHCGRESRLARRLPHSGSFLIGFPTWSHIIKSLYTLPFLYFPRIIKLLTILFFNFELQIDCHDIPENFPIHLMHQSLKFIMCHASSRFLSRLSLSSRRIGLWFRFYFPFFEYFCLFYILLFKIQDSGSFHSPWLVNI